MGCRQKRADPNSVGGKSLFPLPGFIKDRVCWATGEAERLKGSAPYTPEIIAVYQMTYGCMINRSYLSVIIPNVYREDRLYADNEFNVFSLTGPDGSEERKTYELFSEKWRRIYPDYELGPYMHCVAKATTPVLNLDQLVKMLKSKDANLYERCKWIFNDTHGRFLDGAPILSNKIGFISFPRSGNHDLETRGSETTSNCLQASQPALTTLCTWIRTSK